MRSARVVALCIVLLSSAASDGAALELFEENVLPQQAVLATCATLTGEPRATSLSVDKSDLVIGYDDGTLVVFQYDPRSLNIPAHTIRLSSSEPVLDVVGVRPVPRRSSRQDAFVIAVQNGTASLVSTESMQVVHETPLPGGGGLRRCIKTEADERVILLGGPAPVELDVRPASRSWELVVTELPEPLHSLVAAVSAEERFLFLQEDAVSEMSERGFRELPLADGVVVAAELPASCAFGDFIAVAPAADTPSVWVLEERSDAWHVSSTVSVPGEVASIIALTDTSAVVAGGRMAASGDSIGWLAVVSSSGRVLAEEEQPLPIAHVEVLGDWVAAHGTGGVLSVYDSDLAPLWDHASMLHPVDLLAADFDGEGSLDLAVVGTMQQRRSRAAVDSMRALLDRPDLFGGATLVGADVAGRGGTYVREVSRAVIYTSGRGDLEEMLGREMKLAEERLQRGEADSAVASAGRARAAAARLGAREDVLKLNDLLRESRALPERRKRSLVWAAALFVAGVWMTWWYASGGARERRDIMLGGIAALALGVAVAGILGRPPLYGLLFIGGAVPLGALAVTAGLRRAAYGALSPGTPIEELGRRIMGFRHGGQGDFDARPGERIGDDARKNITQLAYLAREMMDARGEPSRYRAMKSVLEKGAATFRESVAPEISRLAALGRELGFMTDALNSMESAASRIDRALTAALADAPPEPEEFARLVSEVRDGRKQLVDSAEAVCAAVLANPGCSLNSVLDDVLSLRRELLATNGVTVTLDSHVEATADAVRGTRYILFTIFENLVVNAVRAMADARQKSLMVTARSDGERCVVTVEDTGHGMTDVEVGALFEESADSSRGGFGLPYSRRALRELGGDMDVESSSGTGTTVTVEIPHWRSTFTGEDHEPQS